MARTYRTALRGFELQRQRQARRPGSRPNPSVAYVEQNHTVHAFGTQPNPPSWGLDRIDQRNLPLNQSYTYPNTAPNVHAYVIDTGIRFTHNDFGGRAISGFDAVDGGCGRRLPRARHARGRHGRRRRVRRGQGRASSSASGCSTAGQRHATPRSSAGIDWVTANAREARRWPT